MVRRHHALEHTPTSDADRFPAYKDGKYIFPNDEVSISPTSAFDLNVSDQTQREADRLDLQHHLLRITYANKLFFAPLVNPRRVLDVGTGTGIWAVDFADDFPDCQVTGIDLSPGQPTLCVSSCILSFENEEF